MAMLAKACCRLFGKPTGVLGRVAGWIMANRHSNRARNLWTIDLLELTPTDRVLELGFGPGIGLALAATRASRGSLMGVDHSAIMVRQASARNAAAIRQGLITLKTGDLSLLTGATERFDKVFSVNVFPFLADQRMALDTIRGVMAAGALLATTYQPRLRKATAEDGERFAAVLAAEMGKAGFDAIRIERLALDPLPAVCVLGRRSP